MPLKRVGLKEYAEGMAILGAADFFVVEDTSPDDVGTKIYDYIYWNKPIIAAAPPRYTISKAGFYSLNMAIFAKPSEEVESSDR